VCQLKCLAFPNAEGKIAGSIGSGFQKFTDFKLFIERNRQIKDVKLSNYGEIFLNPDLCSIMRYAYEQGVGLHADNGSNMNTLSDDVAKALVRYQFRSITCSIDGADNHTYQAYRRNGNFNLVISNIQKINVFKKKFHSSVPVLSWQFVVFGHNEDSIQAAKRLAKELDMYFYLKYSYIGMYEGFEFSPVRNRDLIRKESATGSADREEFYKMYGVNYVRGLCSQLWYDPQINYDGRVLGCCVNYWADYGNAFSEDLGVVLNNERMHYAREMLLGKKPPREDIPCTICPLYLTMHNDKRWLTEQEIHLRELDYAIRTWTKRLGDQRLLLYHGMIGARKMVLRFSHQFHRLFS
jgi:MoaA/NifB/PqqE/SkfB family radical SAM enzyme